MTQSETKTEETLSNKAVKEAQFVEENAGELARLVESIDSIGGGTMDDEMLNDAFVACDNILGSLADVQTLLRQIGNDS